MIEIPDFQWNMLKYLVKTIGAKAVKSAIDQIEKELRHE
jgi:hypothetical protein